MYASIHAAAIATGINESTLMMYVADVAVANIHAPKAEKIEEAIRRIREAEARLAMACPWCGEQTTADEIATELGGRRLHARCAVAFGIFTYDESAGPDVPPIDETDPRVIDAETGAEEAFAYGYLTGEQRGEQVGEWRALGRVA
jgi:hypothetical protein